MGRREGCATTDLTARPHRASHIEPHRRGVPPTARRTDPLASREPTADSGESGNRVSARSRTSLISHTRERTREARCRKPAEIRVSATVGGTERYAFVCDALIRAELNVSCTKLGRARVARRRRAPFHPFSHRLGFFRVSRVFQPTQHSRRSPRYFPTAQVKPQHEMAGADGATEGTPDATYAALEVPRTFTSAPDPVRSVLSHSKSHPRMLESACTTIRHVCFRAQAASRAS